MSVNQESYFDVLIETDNITGPTMPFFHCCDAYNLALILKSQELIPTNCNVFTGEQLLYLFYGRPAYKSQLIIDNALSYFMPVCFIIRPECITNMKRAFPFDSGGFNFYDNFKHPKMSLTDFSLTPNIKSINKTLTFFFGDNNSYFNGIAKKCIDFDPMDFTIEAYHLLINDKGKGTGDDRKNSFEVQVNRPIQLNKETLEAIILPSCLTPSKYFQKFQREVGMEVIEIENYGVASARYYANMLDKTKAYLLKKNYI